MTLEDYNRCNNNLSSENKYEEKIKDITPKKETDEKTDSGNELSMAVRASNYQKDGQYDPAKHSKYENPETQTQYNAVDIFQNGLMDRRVTRIYFASYSDENGFSGFFTDSITINKCLNSDGTFNANMYSQIAQLNVEGDAYHGYKTSFRPNIIAIDIDYKALDALQNSNPELYKELVNPDGLSPDGNEIKVAFGKAQFNSYQGLDIRQNIIEAANQYYIEKETFKKAMQEGVFIVNDKDSFGSKYGKKIAVQPRLRQEYELIGQGVLSKDPNERKRAYKELNKRNDLRIETEKQDAIQGAMIRNALYGDRGLSFTIKPDQINSQQVDGNFICKPDGAYNY